jgi:site-specific DNA recombinase
MTKRATLYARVSTSRQEEEATIESQVAAVEAFAQQHGYHLPAELYFLDQAVSGAQLDRPALDRLRDLAAEGLFDVVLCYSPDRLARHYAHQWVLLDELRRVGVEVSFVNQPAMPAGPQGQLLLGIQGLFAEYERTLITERLRRGKLYRMRQGQLTSPNSPYGYRYVPISEPGGGHWILNPAEAEVVRSIYRWYTEDTLTITQIVERLNSLGEQTPPRGKRWHRSTVQTILTQPAYTGRAYYNRTRVHHEVVGQRKEHGHGARRWPGRKPRPPEEWIEIAVPALISDDVWQRAQECLAMNHKFARRNNKRNFYLLRGLLICGICGHTLAGRTSKGIAYYYCTNYGKTRAPDVPHHTCSVPARVVEPLVWDAVCELLRNPNLLADAWQAQCETDDSDPDEGDRLQQRLCTLDRQCSRLLDAFQDELIDNDELARRKRRLDAEREALRQRLDQLHRLSRRREAKAQMLEDFAVFCRKIEASLTDPTPEVQQEVIRLLIDHIVVEENIITIKHIIPTDDDCRLLPGRTVRWSCKPGAAAHADRWAARRSTRRNEERKWTEGIPDILRNCWHWGWYFLF